MRRYLDYGKRVKNDQGLGELYHWLGKILLDDGSVYAIEERAQAFEIAVCERLVSLWSTLNGPAADLILAHGAPDRLSLYRYILHPDTAPEYRNAWAGLLAANYKKHWSWIGSCASARLPGGTYADSESVRLFDEFLLELEQLAPLSAAIPSGGMAQMRELEEQRERIQAQEEEVAGLKEDLEFAEDRASRAHRRVQNSEKELSKVKRQLGEERENSEKLRQERSRRIKLERQATEAERELERLRREYVKLDQRLHQMAQRLVQAQHQNASGSSIDLQVLRQSAAEQILGLEKPVAEEEISQIRRQFAAIFHPDRVERLPAWVGQFCKEILGIVNEACDRMK